MMKNKNSCYDVIVLGVGGMGSSACYHLSKRGLDVLGIEQFTIPHDQGSSHGETRIIRKAYFEHPDYVPLLNRSYQLWKELEKVADQEIFNRCGVIIYADAESNVYKGTLNSSKMHNISVDRIRMEEALERWPIYRPHEHHSVLYEPDAGFLYPEKAVMSYTNLAKKAGADIIENQKVLEYHSDLNRVTVTTESGKYHAKKLVITAGSWAGNLLSELKIPFRLLRKNLTWHAANAMHDVKKGTPAALFDHGEHLFYLFPMIDNENIKIGKHSGGELVQYPHQKEISKPDESYHTPVSKFIQSHLPHVATNYSKFITCLYTLTPDHHFIIGRHPGDDKIIFAAGFSGHGFKFSSVVGEILADLTTIGDNLLLTDFIKLRKFH